MSRNKILLLILNFFLLICESIEDKNNIIDNINTFNSSNIIKRNIINRNENGKYLRLLEEDTTDDEPIYTDTNEPSDANDDISSDSIKNYIYISFKLLQTKIKENKLNLYILTNSTFPEAITFSLSISIYLSDRIRNLEEIKDSIDANKVGSFKSNNTEKIIILSANLGEKEYAETIQKIILNDIVGINNNELENIIYRFEFKIQGNNDTSTETNVDLSSLDENTTVNIYEQEGMSSCSNDLRFNLTVNNKIDVNENNINLAFTPASNNNFNSNRRSFSLMVPCILSSEYQKNIPCKLEQEPLQFPLTLSTFMEYIDNKLIIIMPLNPDSTIILECYEEPPIAAIISIVVLFFFVVIVVIIIIIVMNKKGRGDRGYEMPNESNSNNILGLGGGASK